MDEHKLIQDVETGLKSMHEKLEKQGEQSSEAKAMLDKIALDVKSLETQNQELKAQRESDAERLALIEAHAAKSKSGTAVDANEIKGLIDSAMVQLTNEVKGTSLGLHELAKKARNVTDPAAGGHLVDERFMYDMLVTYMKDASPMLREANVIRSANAIRIPFKELTFGAKSAGETETSNGKTKREVSVRTIPLSRIYSEDYTTDEFLRAQSYETESTLTSDIMSDIAYQIQYQALRGDGKEKAYGLLLESFLADTSFQTDAAGKLSWTDLFNVQTKFNYEKYRENGKFFMHFDTFVKFLTEKDGEGRPIYTPGINGTRQSLLAGKEFVILPDMDKTVAANTLPVLYGDMKKAYTIVVDGQYKAVRDETTGMKDGIITIGISTMAGGSVVDKEAIRAIKGK